MIRDQILRPPRLTNTSYPTGQSLPKPFARGYFGGLDFNDPLTDATIINPAFAGGAGAMQSTLGDLRKWAKALVTGRLLSRSLQAQRLQTLPFPNTGPVDVGYGLGIFKLDKLLGHNGAGIGYSTAMFYLPSNGATIVVWGNNSTNDSTPTNNDRVRYRRDPVPEGSRRRTVLRTELTARSIGTPSRGRLARADPPVGGVPMQAGPIAGTSCLPTFLRPRLWRS